MSLDKDSLLNKPPNENSVWLALKDEEGLPDNGKGGGQGEYFRWKEGYIKRR